MKETQATGVILVGHGGIPSDYPRDLLTRLKMLESKRRTSGDDPSQEELDLDRRVRHWPRTPQTDPYQAGFEALARQLQASLSGQHFAIAYNEFCAPTVEEAVEAMIATGVKSITVVPSMLTPGGSHSEIEIPESLARLQARHPALDLCYAWPFDLAAVSDMLLHQVQRFNP